MTMGYILNISCYYDDGIYLAPVAMMMGYICISYNMGTSALPDMYTNTRSRRVAGPRTEGIHIRQSTSAYVITNNKNLKRK